MATCQKCTGEVYAKGHCRKHYESQRRRTEAGKLSRAERLAGIAGILMATFNYQISDEEAVVQIERLKHGSVC